MNANVFWVWNGWGVLFTLVVAVWQFLHILVSVKARELSFLRQPLAVLGIAAVVLTFYLSGWVAGLLSIPLGMVIGVTLAKVFVPAPR